MYRQISAMKNFVNSDMMDTLEAAITAVDFDYIAECILTDNYPEEDKDVDHIITYIKSVSTESGETVESGDSTTATLSKAITGWGLSNDCVFISKSGTSYQWKCNCGC